MGFTPVNTLSTAQAATPSAVDPYGPRPQKCPRIAFAGKEGTAPLDGLTPSVGDNGRATTEERKAVGVKKTASRRYVQPLFGTLDRGPAKEKEPRSCLPHLHPAPTISPSKEDFENLEALVASIEKTGREYGIVKVRWVKSTFSRCQFNWNNVPFRLERQMINIAPELEVDLQEKFSKVLQTLLDASATPTALPPCIYEDREVNLYMFHRAVYGRGGFAMIGRLQLWTTVFEDIDVAPVVIRRMGQQLKSYYLRYIMPLDRLLEDNKIPSEMLRRPLAIRLAEPSQNVPPDTIVLPHNIWIGPVDLLLKNQLYTEPLSSPCRASPFLNSTLRQRKTNDWTLNESERQFWELAQTGTAVHYRAKLSQDPSTLPELRFRGDSSERGPESDDSTLKVYNLAYSPWSFFNYMSEDILYDVPQAAVGSPHTCSPWSVSPHPAIQTSLIHYGAPRTWYAVPESAKSQAQSLLHGNLDDPSQLAARGVPVYFIDQHPGEIVFIFPGALTASFEHGGNIVETGFFWPLWFGLNSLPADICSERMIYEIATRAPIPQFSSMRHQIESLHKDLNAGWSQAISLGLDIERHDGKTVVRTASQELRYFFWVQHDSMAYNVSDYSERELKGGRLVAHPQYENMMKQLEERLVLPDYSAIQLLANGRWQIAEFTEAVRTSSIASLRAIAAQLNAKYPQGTDGLKTFSLQRYDDPNKLVREHLMGMPVDIEVERHLNDDILQKLGAVTHGVAAILSVLKKGSVDLDESRAQVANLLEISSSETLCGWAVHYVTFLTRLKAIVEWAAAVNKIFAQHASTSEFELNEVRLLQRSIPDRRLCLTGKGETIRKIIDANQYLLDWRTNLLRSNRNVDNFTRQELEKARDLLAITPLEPHERAEIRTAVQAGEQVLLTGQPDPLKRPRASSALHLIHFSGTLYAAFAELHRWMSENGFVRHLLETAKTQPGRALDIAQRLGPLLHFKVVPDEIPQIVAFMQMQFSRGANMPQDATQYGTGQVAPLDLPQHTSSQPRVPLNYAPQYAYAQQPQNQLQAQFQPQAPQVTIHTPQHTQQPQPQPPQPQPQPQPLQHLQVPLPERIEGRAPENYNIRPQQ